MPLFLFQVFKERATRSQWILPLRNLAILLFRLHQPRRLPMIRSLTHSSCQAWIWLRPVPIWARQKRKPSQATQGSEQAIPCGGAGVQALPDRFQLIRSAVRSIPYSQFIREQPSAIWLKWSAMTMRRTTVVTARFYSIAYWEKIIGLPLMASLVKRDLFKSTLIRWQKPLLCRDQLVRPVTANTRSVFKVLSANYS